MPNENSYEVALQKSNAIREGLVRRVPCGSCGTGAMRPALTGHILGSKP